jgi:hypothetical protein
MPVPAKHISLIYKTTKMSETKILDIPLESWFNSNPSLAFPLMRLSYGVHVDEHGKSYELLYFLCGTQSETIRVYDDGTEVVEKN